MPRKSTYEEEVAATRTYGVEAQAKVTTQKPSSIFGFGASRTRSSGYKFDSPGAMEAVIARVSVGILADHWSESV